MPGRVFSFSSICTEVKVSFSLDFLAGAFVACFKVWLVDTQIYDKSFLLLSSLCICFHKLFSRICVVFNGIGDIHFFYHIILPLPLSHQCLLTPPDITTTQSPNFYPIQFNSQTIHPPPSSNIHNNLSSPNPTSPSFRHRMMPPMMLILLHEHRLPSAIRRKRNRSNAQAGESALESVPAGEGPSVAPCFPNVFISISFFGRVKG